jgi:hypothetical protein
MDWVNLAQHMVRWQGLVNAVLKLRVPLKCGGSRLDEALLDSQEGLCSIELCYSPLVLKKYMAICDIFKWDNLW